MKTLNLVAIVACVIFLSACGQSKEGDLSQTKVGNGKRITFIKKAYSKDKRHFLDVNYVEWLSGEAGIKAALEDKKCTDKKSCLPNGYYIRDKSPEITTLPLADKVSINIIDWKSSNLTPKTATFDELITKINENPFWIEVANNQIVKISEQYRP
jgi:hypothetical protein